MGKKSKNYVNLNTEKTFFSPRHDRDNDMACFTPSPVKNLARELDGKSFSLREAIGKIKKVTPRKVFIRRNFIVMRSGPYIIRVIRYGSARKKINKKTTLS